MSLLVTLLDDKTAPLSPGLRLQLVGDGQVLGRAILTENGDALFDASTAGVKVLSIRLDPQQDLTGVRASVADEATPPGNTV